MNHIYDGIIGLAVGDALGVPVEFMPREFINKNPVFSMREFGAHNQPMGTWSDDTSLTLALLDSLAECGGIDLNDVMSRFSSWLMYGEYTAGDVVFDVGNATSRALMNYGRGLKPVECGMKSEYENGNGSLMRILPLAFYLISDHMTMENESQTDRQMEMIHQISSLTHAHPRSLIACGIYTMVAQELIRSELPLDQAIEKGVNIALNYYQNDDKGRWDDDLVFYRRIEQLDYFRKLPEGEIKSSGYVVHTLEAALWCLLNTCSYETAVLKAINLGDDTDTIGAITGGLAGIYYGVDKIPDDWINTIKKIEYIKALCNKMQKSLGGCTTVPVEKDK